MNITETNTETKRKLAYVAKITNIEPILNADRIEKATINEGWHCVVKKGEFEIGDLCVYIEIDSILPNTSWSKFLADPNRPDKQIRVRTVRLRGQISQGLALPINSVMSSFIDEGICYTSDFPTNNGCENLILEEGTNLTEELGITKYEPPTSLSGEPRGNFPSFIPKTDEERIQSCYRDITNTLSQIEDVELCVTEKIDGSSFTAYIYQGEFGVCSRNIDLKETEGNKFWQIARMLDLENKMRSVFQEGTNVAIQGEMAGVGIQKNRLGLKDIGLYVFNIYSIDLGEYFNIDTVLNYCKKMNLKVAPVLDRFEYRSRSNWTVDNWVDYSNRYSLLNADALVEGIVVRPVEELRDNRGNRISFKVINPDYLIKHGE